MLTTTLPRRPSQLEDEDFPSLCPSRPRLQRFDQRHLGSRLVVLESGLGLKSGLEAIFDGLGLGLGLGPCLTCNKAHFYAEVTYTQFATNRREPATKPATASSSREDTDSD